LAEYISHEEVVVIHSYTIIYPWTVMIESLYALVTHSTMARANSSKNLALRAELSSVKLFQKLKKIYSLPDNSWITHSCHH